jgi:hypothetical protein
MQPSDDQNGNGHDDHQEYNHHERAHAHHGYATAPHMMAGPEGAVILDIFNPPRHN